MFSVAVRQLELGNHGYGDLVLRAYGAYGGTDDFGIPKQLLTDTMVLSKA